MTAVKTPEATETSAITPGPREDSSAVRTNSITRRVCSSWGFVALLRVALILAVLGLWQLAVNQDWIDPVLVGEPTGIWTALGDYMFSHDMLVNTRATMWAVFLAILFGASLGTLTGLLIGASDYLDRLVAPLLVPINSIPRIALAPLFIAWFGLTTTAKVVLAASIVYFILVENSRGAVRAVDADLATMAKVIGLRRAAYVWKVVLPSAVPTLFAGLRLAVTYAMLGVIASEMIAARDGLGQSIVAYSSRLQINLVWAVLIEFIVIAAVIAFVFDVVERRLLRWR